MNLLAYICNFLFYQLPEKILPKRVRNRIYALRIRRSVAQCGKRLVASTLCHGFNRNVHIGDYVNLNGCRIIGNGSVHIGSYFHSGMDLVMVTEDHNYDDAEAIPYDKKRIEKPIQIKDFVWVGHGVTIMGGVTIGEGAIVGAGSLVVKDVPDFAIAGGNPAKVLKYRDIEKYTALKKEGKFF